MPGPGAALSSQPLLLRMCRSATEPTTTGSKIRRKQDNDSEGRPPADVAMQDACSPDNSLRCVMLLCIACCVACSTHLLVHVDQYVQLHASATRRTSCLVRTMCNISLYAGRRKRMHFEPAWADPDLHVMRGLTETGAAARPARDHPVTRTLLTRMIQRTTIAASLLTQRSPQSPSASCRRPVPSSCLISQSMANQAR